MIALRKQKMTSAKSHPLGPARGVHSVLFVCNQNAVRSPMAEAILKSRARGRLYVESAGFQSGNFPDREPDSFTATVMAEKGYDISGHQPHTLPQSQLMDYSVIIALTRVSYDYLKKACVTGQSGSGGYDPRSHTFIHKQSSADKSRLSRLEFWPVADPSDVDGRRDTILTAYRAVRDEIADRIDHRFPEFLLN